MKTWSDVTGVFANYNSSPSNASNLSHFSNIEWYPIIQHRVTIILCGCGLTILSANNKTTALNENSRSATWHGAQCSCQWKEMKPTNNHYFSWKKLYAFFQYFLYLFFSQKYVLEIILLEIEPDIKCKYSFSENSNLNLWYYEN